MGQFQAVVRIKVHFWILFENIMGSRGFIGSKLGPIRQVLYISPTDSLRWSWSYFYLFISHRFISLSVLVQHSNSRTYNMKLLVTGASGYVGTEIIRQSLQLPQVTSVVAVARKPVSVPSGADPARLKSIIVKDYGDYPASVRDEFKDAAACIW
jgi:hypothetical protein